MSPHHIQRTPSVYTQLANTILLCMAVLFAFVFIGQFFVHDPWYDAIYWLVQSALIGSVADWFAVTALFRKPLGISFHTELIPRNKERLINGVVNMVETKLLTYEQCERAITSIRFVPFIDQYIRSDTGRHTLQHGISTLVGMVWERRSERQWAEWGAVQLRKFLHDQSVLGPLQQTLMAICKDNRYESIIIKGLAYLQELISRPAAQRWLEKVIQEEVERRKSNVLSSMLIGLSEGLDIINVQEMARTVWKEVYDTLERWKTPNSLERIVWLQQWVEPLQEMAMQRSVTRTLEEAIDNWIDEQDWETMLEKYVCPRIGEALVGTEEVSHMALVMEESIQNLWHAYSKEEAMVERLEEALTHVALHILTKSHALLGLIVREVLNSLSTERFIDFIESKVEDDLGWIRINGAIVGGVCGLGTWMFLYYVYEPLLQSLGFM